MELVGRAAYRAGGGDRGDAGEDDAVCAEEENGEDEDEDRALIGDTGGGPTGPLERSVRPRRTSAALGMRVALVIVRVGAIALVAALLSLAMPVLLPSLGVGYRIRGFMYYSSVPGHICLDGSSGGYWTDLAPLGDRRHWYIHLNGGGWSYTEETLRARAKMYFGNSSRYAWVKRTPSVFDREGPPPPEFDDWNIVYFTYCSGDMYTGTGNVVAGMKINGANNFDATIAHIESAYGLRRNAHRIVLAGNSAGAGGVVFNVDGLAAAFPNVTVLGSPQSYMFPEIGVYNGSDARTWVPYSDYGDSLIDAGTYEKMFRAWRPRLPRACVDEHPVAPWTCLSPSGVYPYVNTPLFIATALTDYSFSSWYKRWPNVWPYPAGNTTMGSYEREFGRRTREVLGRILRAHNGRRPTRAHVTGVYALSCMLHDGYTNALKIQGMSPARALRRWIDDAGVGEFNHTLIDVCPDVFPPCNPTCQSKPAVYYR